MTNNEIVLANIEDYRSRGGTKTAIGGNVDQSADNLQVIAQAGKTLVFNPRVPASDLVAAVNRTRKILVFVEFAAVREGSDDDTFTAILKYRVGTGAWIVIRSKTIKVFADMYPVSLKGQLTLNSTPSNYIEFALEISNGNGTPVRITNDSSIEFDYWIN